MSRTPLRASRGHLLAYRRTVQELDERLPWIAASLRRAALAGLQDSMPRAALLSIHARVAQTLPTALDDASLMQVWGPRFNVYVIAAQDVAPFTLGRHPDDARGRRRAEELADAVTRVLAGRELAYGEVSATLGIGNAIRYATTTGRLAIRWHGARAPMVRAIEPPQVEPDQARRDLARRYLHVYGPTDAETFAQWAGISAREAQAAFAGLDRELLAVHTPLGERFLLDEDEPTLRAAADLAASTLAAASARLLPSGDAYYLAQGSDRELLVPEAEHRARLWTSRVWPGAVLVSGEIVGTWRRADRIVTIETWRPLDGAEREAVEHEAVSLPLPGSGGAITVRWAD